MFIQLDNVVIEAIIDTGAHRNFIFISNEILPKIFKFKKIQKIDVFLFAMGKQKCQVSGAFQFKVAVYSEILLWAFIVMNNRGYS